MFNKKYSFFTQVFLLTTLVTSGCNDDSSSNTPTEPTTASKITASNAKPIAAAAFTSVDIVKGLPIRSGNLWSVSANVTSDEFNYSDFITNQLSIIQQQSLLMGRSVPKVTANKALECNLHITGDITDASRLSVGDTATFTFNNCTYDSELIVNGTIGITLTQISEDFTGTPPYELGLDTVLTDFMVDNQDSIYTSNGDLSMLFTKNESSDTTALLSGTSISVSVGSASKNNSLTLSNYLIDLNDNSSGDYTVSLQGTIELVIPFANVGASFTTINSFTGNHNIGSGDPTAGELHLTGADDSQAWIIAQPDGVNIQIDIDMDGDDAVDATVMTTWAELQELF
jgi:hypothetical protein